MTLRLDRSLLERFLGSHQEIVQFENLIAGINNFDEKKPIYTPAGYTQQDDGVYIYSARNRYDGAGWLAQRVNLAAGEYAGSTTGSGAIPADLTTLNYS